MKKISPAFPPFSTTFFTPRNNKRLFFTPNSLTTTKKTADSNISATNNVYFLQNKREMRTIAPLSVCKQYAFSLFQSIQSIFQSFRLFPFRKCEISIIAISIIHISCFRMGQCESQSS